MGKDSQENTCLSTSPSTAHLHTEGNKRFADKILPSLLIWHVKNQALWKEGGGTAALRFSQAAHWVLPSPSEQNEDLSIIKGLKEIVDSEERLFICLASTDKERGKAIHQPLTFYLVTCFLLHFTFAINGPAQLAG